MISEMMRSRAILKIQNAIRMMLHDLNDNPMYRQEALTKIRKVYASCGTKEQFDLTEQWVEKVGHKFKLDSIPRIGTSDPGPY